jgi:hypothetical protein
MGEARRARQVPPVVDAQQQEAAIAFGRMWATLLLEDHLGSEQQVPFRFPGQTDDAWLLAGQLTGDPLLRLEVTTLIKGQAEESWLAMTCRVFCPHRRTWVGGRPG